MSQYEEIEPQGIIVNSEFKASCSINEKNACNRQTAAESLKLQETLDIMLRSGAIGKTSGGKYYVTKKGRQKQLKGFKIARK